MEISKSLAQVGSAQEDKQCWKFQDWESQCMAKLKLCKLKWLIFYFNLILSIGMPSFNWQIKSVMKKGRWPNQSVILASTSKWYWNDGLIRCSIKWEGPDQLVGGPGRKRTALEWPINLVMSIGASPNQSVRLWGARESANQRLPLDRLIRSMHWEVTDLVAHWSNG